MYVIVRIDCWGSAYHKHMRNYFFQALAPKLLLLFIAFIVAAASYGGFFQKWEFRDGTTYSAPTMFEGTAKRPFVYRQLLPSMANLIEYVTPDRISQGFEHWLAANPLKHNLIYRYFPNAKDSVAST